VKHVALLVVLVVLSSGPVAHGIDRPQDAAKTIAVLDFVNRNPADGRDWLGKGLADMVITDLSASQRLTVVDRERVQDLAREIDLGAAGILDPKTAPRVGQIAKVRWILFGTFLHHGAEVSIEAMLIDAGTGQTVRIEQVVGPVSKLFDLEQSLVQAILAKLDVPMTEEELRVVKLLKTESLPAFEHYARSLGLFDEGKWFDALREARLARRADPAYFPAAARLAQLFYDVGEPEHAVIEYRRFVQQDRSDKLPAEFYLTLGKILEQALADRAGAIAVFQQLIRRDSRYDQPFRITDPARPSHAWDDVGGMSGVNALFQEQKASLEAMERLASWQLEAGQQADAARQYGRLWLWLTTHGMPLGAGEAGTGFHAKVLEKYGPLYWRMVLENRDATLHPPCSLYLLPAEMATVGPDTAPTHGYYKWQYGPVWLAPPDREIAEVSFSLEDDGSGRDKALGGNMAIDFKCMGYTSILMKQPQVKPDGTWHTLKLDPGIRALQTYAFTNRWQMKFMLRPWSQPAKVPEVGSFQVNFLPPVADLQINGKLYRHINGGLALVNEPTGQYEVNVRWPDGRRRSATFQITKGKRGELLMNADVNNETVLAGSPLSRQILAPDGSNTYLLTDRTGRIWLLWDQVCRNDMM
jgi:TolB-like protein